MRSAGASADAHQVTVGMMCVNHFDANRDASDTLKPRAVRFGAPPLTIPTSDSLSQVVYKRQEEQ